MKKIIAVLMLVTGILITAIAQEEPVRTKTDNTFEPPLNSITRRFTIDLGRGNKMQLELSAMENINHIKNIDSLVRVFLQDLEPLKDSLSNELLSKRIDYVTDSLGRKKIRIQQYQPKGSSFLVTPNDVASLKVEQDTIFISGTVPGKTVWILSKKAIVSNYYRIGFFVNQLTELPGYLDGRLNEKMNAVQKSDNEKWSAQKDENYHIRNGDPAIYAKQPKGYYFSWRGDYLELNAGLNLQNYKNYFVPSFTLKATAFIKNEHYKHEIGFAWEPHFLFSKNSQGNLQTFRNDFITLLLGREPLKNKEPDGGPHFNFFQHLSVGYLVRQKGDFYDPHTFRLGTGGINWNGGRLKLEPLLYFHDFFEGATPGLRLSVSF